MSSSGASHRPPAPATLPAEIETAVRAAQDKKGADILVMDLRGAGAFTDFFVICSGQNPRQVSAIAEHIEDALRQSQVRPSHVEGFERAEWVLLDYFDFIVHIFNRETRMFYALDRLWGSAPRITIADRDSRTASPPSTP
jgi:ribosome-associated protein